MDAIIILLALGSVFVGLILLIVTKFRRKVVVEKPAVVARPVPVDREDVAGGVRRGARRRPRRMVREQPEEEIGLEDDDDHEELDPDEFLTFDDKNMGKKKREKMEKKMERRKMREMEAEERLEKKEREERLMEERRHEAELEELEEKKKEEEERLKKEEEEKRQHEEYLILKESFTVEEEGQEKAMSLDEAENLLQKFVDYIKQKKVVILEDLAAEFFMRTQDAIKRVQELQEEGRLTGVVDDRGKFIYISQDELDGFARFIRQRGRVSITELAEASNTLINLQPDIISLEQTVS